MTTTDPLLTIALERGLCTVDDALEGRALTEALAREFGLPCVNLAGRTIPAGILASLPRSFVLEHAVLPFAREGGVPHVAVADPIDSLGARAARARPRARPAGGRWFFPRRGLCGLPRHRLSGPAGHFLRFFASTTASGT